MYIYIANPNLSSPSSLLCHASLFTSNERKAHESAEVSARFARLLDEVYTRFRRCDSTLHRYLTGGLNGTRAFWVCVGEGGCSRQCTKCKPPSSLDTRSYTAIEILGCQRGNVIGKLAMVTEVMGDLRGSSAAALEIL